MSQFEIISLTLSLVLGLSISHMLWATASLIRARKRIQFHWLPFLWTACIFFHHVQFWFAAFDVNKEAETWTWSLYLNILFLGIALVLSGALVLPSESQEREGRLLDDFKEHGRLGLIPLACYQFFWIPTNIRIGADLFSTGNIANIILTAFIVVGVVAQKKWLQYSAALLYAILLVWAVLFIWAPIDVG